MSTSANSSNDTVGTVNTTAAVYVTCERARVAKWISKKSSEADSGDDSNSRSSLAAIKLVGFKAYIVEQWLFDSHLPCVVVVLTNVATDSITVCQVKVDMIDPAYKTQASEFFGVNGSGFSSQTTRFGTITLINPNRTHNLDLIPVEGGDYEAVRENVELAVSLKRVCCGTNITKLEDQSSMFWRNYGELVLMSPTECSVKDALSHLVSMVQHFLLVFNYLQLDTFTPGYLDMASLNAIAICRTDMILLFPQLDQEKMQFPAYIDIQLIMFLREQYDILKKAFERFNVDVDILKLNSVESVTKDNFVQWNSILKKLGLREDESLIQFLPILVQQSEEKGVGAVVMDEEEETKKKRHQKSHLSRLKKELKAEQDKRASLEMQASYLKQAVDTLNAELSAAQNSYARLREDYNALVSESEAREKELDALRQSCDIAHSRMARQVAQVSEMIGASKYSIQTNTQKVQQLESHVRKLEKSNKSVVTNVILPYALKALLAVMSFVLFFVSWCVRGAKSLFSQQDKAPSSLLAAENYVQTAQLWMLSLQQRQEQQANESEPALSLSAASPPPQSSDPPTTDSMPTTTTSSSSLLGPGSIGFIHRHRSSPTEDGDVDKTSS